MGSHWIKISCPAAKKAAIKDMRDYYKSIGKKLIFGNPKMKRVNAVLEETELIVGHFKHLIKLP